MSQPLYNPFPDHVRDLCNPQQNQCTVTPTRCVAKDYDGSWVAGQSCDGGKTCQPHAVGNACYSQCVDGVGYNCQSFFNANSFNTFLS